MKKIGAIYSFVSLYLMLRNRLDRSLVISCLVISIITQTSSLSYLLSIGKNVCLIHAHCKKMRNIEEYKDDSPCFYSYQEEKILLFCSISFQVFLAHFYAIEIRLYNKRYILHPPPFLIFQIFICHTESS